MGNFVGARNGVFGRRSHRWRLTAVTTVAALLAATLVVLQPAARAEAAGSSCGANINPVVCENQKTGTDPDVWDIPGAGDPTIQGFATEISVNAGQKIDFKVDTDASAYSIDVYRTGWYQGLGARKIASVTPSATLPQHQPECVSDVTTELYDCGTWGVSASWNVPADAVSGVYIARLKRTDTNGASHIIFIVRKDGNTSDVQFQTSDPTWQAYNTYGGSNFYQGAANGRAHKISYNRPIVTRNVASGRDFYFSSEYATVRFLERNGYDVSYIAGLDTDRRRGELLNHDVFLSVGHDEYWSGAQRANIEAARDAGVNLQFLTGNEGYWRTRYDKSVDGSNTPYRTLVSYKETWSNAKIDPDSQWTGTWRDPRFATAERGGTLPENNLTGTMYMVNDDDLPVTVTSEEGKTRLWRNTNLASLSPGTSAALAPHTIGYESNEDIDNGHRPHGLIRLSTAVGPTPQYLTDYGNTVVAGTTQHHVTLYKASSGALVFSAASIQWGWGLDETHDGNGAAADSRMQQAQVNLLADMNAAPGTLMPGLVAPTKSVDITPPTTVITSPTEGQAVAHGTQVTVTGTAADVAGRVAGVELSSDGGGTWHPAVGTTNWSYSYVQQGDGPESIIARAIDDSANYSAAGTTRLVSVSGPASAFGAAMPAVPATTDSDAYELGLRFEASHDGFVAGVRFYKGVGNTGTHTGSLWDSAGNRLASVVFTGETETGWQEAQFGAPVHILEGQTYTVSYTAPSGRYSVTERYWPYKATPTSPITVKSALGTAAPGVFGLPGAYPTSTWTEANYFVDVLFTKSDTSPLRISGRTPSAGVSSVPISTPITATLTRAATPVSVSMTVTPHGGQPVAGAVTYDAPTKTLAFRPTSALAVDTAYSVALTATDSEGVGLEPGAGWSFTTQPADLPVGECPCSLFSEAAVPPVTSAPDPDLVTLGVKFTADIAGIATALKFYKGQGNQGSHTGAIWSADGVKLATATFTDESAGGWQKATFDSPVRLTPGVQYVASYVAPQGAYAATAGKFASAYTRGPLSVPANGAVFTYSTGFPTQASSTDYAVDIVFSQSTDIPRIVSRAPAAGATDVPLETPISATFAAEIRSDFVGKVIADGVEIAGTWSLSVGDTKATFTPASTLAAGAQVLVTLTAVRSAAGAIASPLSWSFTLSNAAAGAPVSFFAGSTPAVADSGDTGAVELGMAFTSSTSGQVRAIRFYKTATNAGTHTGSLWGPNGQRLATVTFAGESASGWQRAALSTPVAIAPGVQYTVSYHAPQGHYSFSAQAFASAVSAGPLTAVSPANGRFRYGAGETPVTSWNSANYFVDLEFVEDPSEQLAITSTSPSSQSVDVALSAMVSATVDQDPMQRELDVTLTSADGVVEGDVSYDAAGRLITFDPATALSRGVTYTATLTVDGVAIDSWVFKTVEAVQTLFGSETPHSMVPDTDPIEIGTAFTVAEPGEATAIRFYKADANGGYHRGTLWGPTGQVLAQVDFVNETAYGWQRAALSEPVALAVDTTYTVSYFSASGRYSYTSRYFADARRSGDITGLATQNGRFVYGADGGFPTSSWNATAYFVDAEVTFGGAPDPTPTPPPGLTGATPAADAVGVPVPQTVSATVSNATAAELVLTANNSSVPGSSVFNGSTGVVSFTPTSPLQRGTTYSAAVTANGSPVQGGNWSFSTRAITMLSASTPSAGATNVDPTSAAISATLTNASTASLSVLSNGSPVPGTSTFNPATGVVSFSPSAVLQWGRTYTVATVADGVALAAGTWSFQTKAPATISGRAPAAAATNVNPATAKITATLSGATSAAIQVTLAGANVAGTSSFNTATGVVAFTPTAQLGWAKAYTATVIANGAPMTNGSWSFTTIAKPDQVALFTTGTPTNSNANAGRAYQAGTRFKSSAAGVVTTIRYYKGTQNTGTHTGYLRNATGTVLAQATFINETSSGWQTVVLSTPVRLTVGAEYRVTVHSTSGRYALTTSGLATAVTSGPLSSIGGIAGAGTANPTTTSTNKFWVDVIFDPDN